MKSILLLITLFAFSLPASAALFVSIEDRSDAIAAQTQGNNSYHAHLARELAVIAVVEKGQHDLEAAKEFIKLAEEHAAKAGGK